jgi:hypothetical protein
VLLSLVLLTSACGKRVPRVIGRMPPPAMASITAQKQAAERPRPATAPQTAEPETRRAPASAPSAPVEASERPEGTAGKSGSPAPWSVTTITHTPAPGTPPNTSQAAKRWTDVRSARIILPLFGAIIVVAAIVLIARRRVAG